MLDTPTKYCEQLISSSFEPINLATNIAFIIFTLLALHKLKTKKGILKLLLPFFLILIGVGSAWWHTTQSTLGDTVDTLSILVFASTITLLLLFKVTQSKTKTLLLFTSLFSVTLYAEQIPHLNGSLPYITLLTGLILLGFFFIRKFPTSKLLFFSAIITFALAIFFRSIDMSVCEHIPIGTHFIWHILVAFFGYLLILLTAR